MRYFFRFKNGPFSQKAKKHNLKTDDNGNAMFQSYSFQIIQKRNRLKIRSYRRYGEQGEKYLFF